MLKLRIITTLMFDNGVLFRTKKFVADYRYTVNFVDLGLTDEVILLDISREGPRQPYYDILDKFSDSMLPLSAGGRISTMDEAHNLISNYPVDKFVIGTAAYENPGFISELAHKYGSQAVVVAVDIGGNGNVFYNQGRTDTQISPVEYARQAEGLGAGELYIQSVERDGSLSGYDTDSFAAVSAAVGIPVIYGNGCGGWHHLVSGYRAGASGCALTNIHHYPASALKAARSACVEAGLPMRKIDDHLLPKVPDAVQPPENRI